MLPFVPKWFRRVLLGREIAFLERTIRLPLLGMFFLAWAVVLPLIFLTLPGLPLVTGITGSIESPAISTAFAVAACLYALAVLSLLSPIFFGGYFRALQAFFGNIKPCEQRLKQTRQAYANLQTEAP